MTLRVVRDVVLPRLIDAGVTRVTLTGGEPFAHPDLLAITESITSLGLEVGICTNATLIEESQLRRFAQLRGVHLNVSLDGFSRESHGKFRGDPASFDTTVDTIRRISRAGLLQGLLSTPNSRTTGQEYEALTRFAEEVGAAYVLMNPMGSYGRGERSQARLAATHAGLAAAHLAAESQADEVQVVPIRIPRSELAPLSGCVAGRVIYVFTNGDVALCPYLVFAARNSSSRYEASDFMVGNIYDGSVAPKLEGFDPRVDLKIGSDSACTSCSISGTCGRGCPAAVVAAGGSLGSRDVELCEGPA